MEIFQGFTRVLTTGAPAPYQTITVLNSGTIVAATIYSDNIDPPTVKSNPFTADVYGGISFYAPPGVYTVQVSANSLLPVHGFIGYSFPITLGLGGGIPSYTQALLPPAGDFPVTGVAANAGSLARRSNTRRGVVMDTGVRWYEIAGDQCNVQNFGALGNGSTPDTAAFQAAIDACTPNGGVVLVPPTASSYVIDGTLTVPGGVTIRGSMGRFRGSRIYDSSGGVLFNLAGNAFETRTLQGLTIVGGAGATYGILARGIDTRLLDISFELWEGNTCIRCDLDTVSDGPFPVNIDGLIIRNWNGVTGTCNYGVHFVSNWNAGSMTNFIVAGCKDAGIWIQGANGARVQGGNVSDCRGGSGNGILVGGGGQSLAGISLRDVYCENNELSECTITHGNGVLLDNFYADGLDACSYGIRVVAAVSGDVADVIILGGYLHRHTYDISFLNANNPLIFNNYRDDAVLTPGNDGFIEFGADPAIETGASNAIYAKNPKTTAGAQPLTVAKATNYSVLFATDSGKTFTNLGAGGTVTFTLPVPILSMRLSFCLATLAQAIALAPSSGAITILGYVAGATVTSGTGTPHAITLVGVSATAWAIEARLGTWT